MSNCVVEQVPRVQSTLVKKDNQPSSPCSNNSQEEGKQASTPIVEPVQAYLTSKKRPFQSIKVQEPDLQSTNSDSESENEEENEDEENEDDEDDEDVEENNEQDEESSSGSSSSEESECINSTTNTANTANTAWRNKDGDMYYQLSAKHRCTVQGYLGQAYIDLREYLINNTTGATYPTTKGIKLNINDWNTFLRCVPNLSKALKDLPIQSPEIIQSQKAKLQKKCSSSQKFNKFNKINKLKKTKYFRD